MGKQEATGLELQKVHFDLCLPGSLLISPRAALLFELFQLFRLYRYIPVEKGVVYDDCLQIYKELSSGSPRREASTLLTISLKAALNGWVL